MPLLSNPRLKKNIHLERLSETQMMLTSEYSGTLLASRSHTLVLALIAQEQLSTDQLLLKLTGQLFPHQVFEILNELEQAGYLTEAYESQLIEHQGFWERLEMNPQQVAQVLEEKKISVQVLGEMDGVGFAQACVEMGLQLDEDADLLIVLTSRYDSPELAAINKHALANQQAWLLIQPTGTEALVGPLFVPNQTACWECFKHRLDLNQPHKRFYQATGVEKKKGLTYPCIQHPVVMNMVYRMAVLEVVKWLYGNGQLENTLLALDSRTMMTSQHQLVKRPQCKVCGEPHQHQRKVIELKKQAGQVTASNGYRTISAEETYARYQHHISKWTGIIPILKPYPQTNHLVHNYFAGQNMALSSKSLFWLNQHQRSGNSGKGKTAIQAKVSAIGEAIERYSMMFHEANDGMRARFTQLKAAIHPQNYLHFSEQQYANREQLNAENDRFYALIPKRFDEEAEMVWTPVYSLTHQQFKYLPACYCYAQYPGKDEAELYAYPDSNGCAAGNTMEEAILQGLLELIERDAVAIWWYNRIKRPAIELDSVQSGYIQELRQFYQQKGRSLYALDLTHDLGIPCFVAISHRVDQALSDEILFGFGTHLDAGIALERAITELNQMLPVVNGKAYQTDDQVFRNWLKTAMLQEHEFMQPLNGVVKQLYEDFPPLCAPNIYDSIQQSIQVLAQKGMEVLVLDLTQPDVNMPVAKVMVPGLRHFWKRLAPGRLYDVPVEMGWLTRKLTEAEMNPLGFFL